MLAQSKIEGSVQLYRPYFLLFLLGIRGSVPRLVGLFLKRNRMYYTTDPFFPTFKSILAFSRYWLKCHAEVLLAFFAFNSSLWLYANILLKASNSVVFLLLLCSPILVILLAKTSFVYALVLKRK